MNWNLFWTAFGAVGGTIGALATAGAVIVALWQPQYSQKKKLKLYFTEVSKVWDQRTGKTENFISLSATNVGNRKVISIISGRSSQEPNQKSGSGPGMRYNVTAPKRGHA